MVTDTETEFSDGEFLEEIVEELGYSVQDIDKLYQNNNVEIQQRNTGFYNLHQKLQKVSKESQSGF